MRFILSPGTFCFVNPARFVTRHVLFCHPGTFCFVTLHVLSPCGRQDCQAILSLLKLSAVVSQTYIAGRLEQRCQLDSTTIRSQELCEQGVGPGLSFTNPFFPSPLIIIAIHSHNTLDTAQPCHLLKPN